MVLLLVALAMPRLTAAQATRPTTAPSNLGAMAQYKNRPIEDVRILGNRQVSTQSILNQIRTREGEKFDPTTVEEDYQRVYGLRRFANVQATVEPTSTGVIVIFTVTEQNQIKSIAYRGNTSVDTKDLQDTVDLKVGESIDPFRVAMARRAIENLYKEKNHPSAHVETPQDDLTRGELVFNITEGPRVRIRKVAFVGNKSFSTWRLKDEVKTAYWIWIFRAGNYDPEQVEEDVASVRRFYESKGFFDARVGRKLIVSPDQTEMQVNFLVDEGPRYSVNKLIFKGNTNLSDSDLRNGIKLVEGQPYDQDLRERDIRQMVRDYSPLGLIYQVPQAGQGPNPDYLHIEPRLVFHREAGQVDLIYDINEGKRFRIGRILVKGNAKTQDKVVLRELHVTPGQKYNSSELQDAQDRLKGTPFFQQVNITPIGDEPESRDVLVEVTEQRTASFTVGAGISSNGGIGGGITYEQKNFDIANWPSSWHDVISERTLTGAGQTFRASFEPGTIFTNASLLFSEPYLFDQPYSFTAEAYLRNRIRENYTETRFGGRTTFGKRFNYIWSTSITLRGEDVEISEVENPSLRAPEIVALEGHSTLTSIALSVRRDTTNKGPLLYRGTNTTATWESAGALGGDFTFQRFSAGWNAYQTIGEDLLDRKTVLDYHLSGGYITPDAPFFERFYGGGFGSIRGFKYRGVSPRAGIQNDVIGGDFILTGGLELSFPLAANILRGVVFTDVGTVESDPQFGNIRSSVGAGVRVTLPFLGQIPIAIDFALPITKDSEDETQLISFSIGFFQ